MTFARSLFVMYTLVDAGNEEMGKQEVAKICDRGDVNVILQQGDATIPCKFKNVLDVPDFK